MSVLQTTSHSNLKMNFYSGKEAWISGSAWIDKTFFKNQSQVTINLFKRCEISHDSREWHTYENRQARAFFQGAHFWYHMMRQKVKIGPVWLPAYCHAEYRWKSLIQVQVIGVKDHEQFAQEIEIFWKHCQMAPQTIWACAWVGPGEYISGSTPKTAPVSFQENQSINFWNKKV